jgi:hypothetical protein
VRCERLETDALPGAFAQLDFSLVRNFNDNSEELPINRRPTTVEPHDQKLGGVVFLHITFEGAKLKLSLRREWSCYREPATIRPVAALQCRRSLALSVHQAKQSALKRQGFQRSAYSRLLCIDRSLLRGRGRKRLVRTLQGDPSAEGLAFLSTNHRWEIRL